MAWKIYWVAAKQIGSRIKPLPAPTWSRQVITRLGAIGLLAAAAALVLTTAEAEAQSDSGSSSSPGFSVGFDAIQLDGGGGGGKRDGSRLKSGSSFGGGGGSKNHGVNFGDLRERCLEDQAFRRRNSETCRHLLD
jgi:hypothetical protein